MTNPFVPMTRKEYDELNPMEDTTRIENISREVSWFEHMKIVTRHSRFTGWYHHHDVIPGTLHDGVRKLTELLGFGPLTYVDYSYRNAIYAFYWRSNPIFLCKSVRGVTMQVLPTFAVKDLRPFYTDLLRVLKI